jgi:hypothetical protein
MQRPIEADAFSNNGKLHATLMAAVADVASLPPGETRTWAVRGLASLLLGQPEAFTAAAFEQVPELASAEPIPDTYLTAEEQEAEACLTPTESLALDSALVGGAVASWRKVSRVVGDAMVTLQGRQRPLPLGVYVRRVEALAKRGDLEARGHIQFMRLGEVRLPGSGASAA